MDPQTKLANIDDQNTLKFYKILILVPYVLTGARHLEKCGANEVQHDKFMQNFEIFYLFIAILKPQGLQTRGRILINTPF